MMLISLLGLGCALSLALNAYLFVRMRGLKKKPHYTVDANRLLHLFTQGQAILDMRVVDPSQIILRSPR